MQADEQGEALPPRILSAAARCTTGTFQSLFFACLSAPPLLGHPPAHLRLGKGGYTQSEVIVLAVRSESLNALGHCRRAVGGFSSGSN